MYECQIHPDENQLYRMRTMFCILICQDIRNNMVLQIMINTIIVLLKTNIADPFATDFSSISSIHEDKIDNEKVYEELINTY